MNIGQLTASLGVDTRGLMQAEAAMQRFERRADTTLASVNRKLKMTGASMKKVGKSMTMYLTMPMALVGGAAAKMYMEFEASMSKVVGLVGVSKSQVSAWSDELINMSAELAKAPKEMADAMFFITSAGLRGANAMDALTYSAKASVAGLGETKDVADLVTSAMNAWGPSVLNAAKATDVLTATVREGKAEAALLAQSMGMVLPIASNMGVTFNEVGAAIAAMTRTGTKAQTASMQLRQILASILKPTVQADEALVHMGISSAQLRKTIREDGLLTVLKQLKELSLEYGEQTMSTVFPNIRALSGVLDIMGANAEENYKLFGRMADATGSLNNAFEEATLTAKFKWDKALAGVQTTLTALGETVMKEFAPILEAITRKMRKLTDWFNSLSDAQKSMVIRTAALVGVAGPLLTMLGFLVGNVLPGLLTVGFRVVKMFNALKIAVMSNPFTALAAALTVVTVVLVAHIKKVKQAKELYKGMDRWTIAATKNTLEQKIAVEQLYRVAQDENRELEKRQAALRQLNRISPEYFGNLSTETINTKKATAAKQKYIQELLREAKVKAAQEELIKLEKEAFAKITQMEGLKTSTWQNLKTAMVGAFGGAAKAAAYAAEQGYNNFEQTKESIANTRKELESYIDALLTTGDISGGVFGGDPDRPGHVVKRVDVPALNFRGQEDAMFQDLGLSEKAFEKVDVIKAANAAIVADTQEAYAILNAIEADAAAKRNARLNEVKWYVGIVGNAFQGMSNVIANSLQSTEKFFDAFKKFFGDFIKGMIIKLISATIAALALVAVISLIPGFGGAGAFQAIKEAQGFGNMMKAGIGTMMGTGMAEGGIVPPGYPNDTFHARLSSGEEVIPAREAQRSINPQKVIFEIEGTTLKGVLSNIERRTNSYS